jgi:hypothetical protein
MKHKGFNSKWLKWTASILSSGTSAILLNGIPGKQFVCKRGVRQGDTLSPPFYVSLGMTYCSQRLMTW